jgi:rhodanese-related sulfurtransferase
VYSQLGPSIAAIIASILTAYVLFRSRTPKLLKDELVITRERCQRFEIENKALIEAGHQKDVEIADLKARTDLTEIQKTQRDILVLCSTTAKSMDSMAKTIERISASLPLAAQLMKTPPATNG